MTRLLILAALAAAFTAGLLVGEQHAAAHTPLSSGAGAETVSAGQRVEPLPPAVRLPSRPRTSPASRSETRKPLRHAVRREGPTAAQWAALRDCESTGNYRAVSPSGTYRGAYQFDVGTWADVGGHGDPAAASNAEQDYRARLLYADRGAQPWPVCGRWLQ